MNPARKEPDVSTYSGRCARRLRELRERAGLTVEQVAEALGVSYRAVYHWERGTNEPKLDYLPELARLYGLKSPRSVLAPQ